MKASVPVCGPKVRRCEPRVSVDGGAALARFPAPTRQHLGSERKGPSSGRGAPPPATDISTQTNCKEKNTPASKTVGPSFLRWSNVKSDSLSRGGTIEAVGQFGGPPELKLVNQNQRGPRTLPPKRVGLTRGQTRAEPVDFVPRLGTFFTPFVLR